MNFDRIVNAAVSFIYPPICPVCGEIVRRPGTDICPECEKKISYVQEPYCMKCGKPVRAEDEYCSDCMAGRHMYDEGRAALIYDEYMSLSIYAFKYGHKKEFAKFYARVLCERLKKKMEAWDPDVLIPVPIHKSKMKKRGFNQAYLIAKEMSKRLNIPVADDIVTRSAATKVQKNLGALERQNNLKKAFKVTQNVVKLNSVVIVDDIYTTGATVDAIARCLKGAGVGRVYFVSLCIGRGN